MLTNHDSNLKIYVVYSHSNTLTKQPFYVGCGSLKRAKDLCGNSRNKGWLAIKNEIGKENIKVDIIAYFFSPEQAYDYESYLIEDYRNKGYNLTNILAGGIGNNLPKDRTNCRSEYTPIFDYLTGEITNGKELRKEIKDKSNNYYYRLASGEIGQNKRYKYIDLMTPAELKSLANLHGALKNYLN
ncbi:GIY-YIG nuclease family protein [Paenimyroides baculatum]|uniref:GIY-YIG domain-containing protein n=1 Tax=Paenimyroides baculatum TaxID=2608000 RepID=A0A5M6CIN5_9FLAO|nr:hypothetical protein [Paenimyroides baculatum]KAA5534320.1 hypothetical protein F0460_09435 [Paenimyroides baculatum]